MNNVKSLSIILLLSLAMVPLNYAKGGDCPTNNGCDARCSTDRGDKCDDVCDDCNNNDCNGDCNGNGTTSTFLRPRQDTTNLTLLNNLTSYNRTHDAASLLSIARSSIVRIVASNVSV